MPTLSTQDRRRREARAPSQLREATVLDPALTAEGWMRVELDQQEGATRECPWMPRVEPDGVGGLTLVDPTPGDAAVVMESDAGNIWVVCWWPQ